MTTVIGDSNVAGFGNVKPYPDLLEFTNLGVPSSRLGDWIRHAEWLEAPITGDLYIQLGSNDVALPISQWWSQWISTLAQRGLDNGARQVHLVLPPPQVHSAEHIQTTVDNRLAQVDAAMWAACDRSNGAVVCDIDLSGLDTALLKEDGLHFTQAGHDYVASEILNVPEPNGVVMLVLSLVLLVLVKIWRK